MQFKHFTTTTQTGEFAQDPAWKHATCDVSAFETFSRLFLPKPLLKSHLTFDLKFSNFWFEIQKSLLPKFTKICFLHHWSIFFCSETVRWTEISPTGIMQTERFVGLRSYELCITDRTLVFKSLGPTQNKLCTNYYQITAFNHIKVHIYEHIYTIYIHIMWHMYINWCAFSCVMNTCRFISNTEQKQEQCR